MFDGTRAHSRHIHASTVRAQSQAVHVAWPLRSRPAPLLLQPAARLDCARRARRGSSDSHSQKCAPAGEQ
eukprot:15299328-Heterocapsa_arctica.AAC.1